MALSPEHIRILSIVKQGLHQRPEETDQTALAAILRQIGLLQLDSISVTARSHYLVMLSRAGLYDRTDLDGLLNEGNLFEQWAHAACLIPMEHYPYFEPVVAARREDDYRRWFDKMGDDPHGLMEHILAEIRQNGPMSSKDFETKREGSGNWWNWKPSKIALEYLFDCGHVMVSHRVKFQRYYDLTERVLDGHHSAGTKTLADFHRWATLAGLRHLGVGTLDHIADYYRLKKGPAKEALQVHLTAGEIEEVDVAGWGKPAYLHKDDKPLLDAIMAGEHQPELTVFLSPFDNLIWYRDRVEDLFNFFYRVEIYTPAAKRQYGYYVMPILHRDKIVGRIDPKIDRKKRTFIMHALHLEPGVDVTDDLIEGLRGSIREFMAFHDCTNFTLGRATSPILEDALARLD